MHLVNVKLLFRQIAKTVPVPKCNALLNMWHRFALIQHVVVVASAQKPSVTDNGQ